MLIYTIDNNLFIQANRIIGNAKVKIMDMHRNVICECSIDNTDCEKFTLELPNGKYLVRVTDINKKTEKQVFLRSVKNI